MILRPPYDASFLMLSANEVDGDDGASNVVMGTYRRPAPTPLAQSVAHPLSEGGTIRLETLVELKFVNSSFSSLSSYCN